MQSENKLLTQAEVRSAMGGVTSMTIWRWLQDQKLDFPKPIKIKTRNYWRSSDLSSWIESKGEAA